MPATTSYWKEEGCKRLWPLLKGKDGNESVAQAKVMTAIGCSHSKAIDLRKGDYVPDVDEIRELAEQAGCDVAYLLGLDGKE